MFKIGNRVRVKNSSRWGNNAGSTATVERAHPGYEHDGGAFYFRFDSRPSMWLPHEDGTYGLMAHVFELIDDKPDDTEDFFR